MRTCNAFEKSIRFHVHPTNSEFGLLHALRIYNPVHDSLAVQFGTVMLIKVTSCDPVWDMSQATDTNRKSLYCACMQADLDI